MFEELIKQIRAENIELKAQNAQLKERLDVALNEIACLKEEVQNLKDEIAVLKKQKPRPKIPPNILEGPNSQDKQNDKGKIGRGKHPRRKKSIRLDIHKTVRLKPEWLPMGAVFKGLQKFSVQDIQFKSFNTVYERERWQLPDGSYVTAELPKEVVGHYGAELKAYVLDQHYKLRVTEPLLLEHLLSKGILISAGQLSKILIGDNEEFYRETQEILRAGIQTGQIHVDDIGARHDGKNAYTTVISNTLFAFFSTNYNKSRVNFLKILHGGEPKYLLNDDSWAYILEESPNSRLPGYLKTNCPEQAMTQAEWYAFLSSKGVTTEGLARLATEAALFSSLIEHGVPRDLKIHADDAGQFAVFILSLCWIHEERHYRKFQVFQPETELAIQKVRGQIWELYKGLKAYKETPTASEKARLEQEFDALFLQKTSSALLNDRLALTYEKKDRLLLVLEIPSTPLHNNPCETDGRSGVVIKRVSGGTRSDDGKKARDTFLSLKQTARKLGINFCDYLFDRLSGLNEISRLADLIRAQAAQPVGS